MLAAGVLAKPAYREGVGGPFGHAFCHEVEGCFYYWPNSIPVMCVFQRGIESLTLPHSDVIVHSTSAITSGPGHHRGMETLRRGCLSP